jgi:competence protein ComEA
MESDRVREILARAGLERLPPRVVGAGVVVLALMAALALWRFWPTAPAPEVVFTTEAVEPAAASMPETAAPGPELVVHVTGAVLRPGVYTMSPGDRVADAVAAAGGALGCAASDAVNLARIIADGERIYIPTLEELEAGLSGDAEGGPEWGAGASAGAVSAAGVVDINRATVAELETLPGVGPATAQKIVDDREANGPFAAPEDLMRVPGIGAKKFEAMRDQVSTG